MRRTNLLMACTLAGVVWGLAGVASAQAPQSPDVPATRDVYFTFSQAVTIPNQTLPAGRYLFRVSGQGRNLVEIYSGDKSRMIQRVMAVHAVRADAPERAELRLIESAADAPVAIGTWWYPLQREGWEFIYPREQALKLARTARQPILTTADDVAADRMSSSGLVRVEPTGAQSDYAPSTTQPTQVRGTAQVGDVAEDDANANRVAAAMSGQTPAASSTMARAGSAQNPAGRATLPRTASAAPAVALVSLLALAAALALGVRRGQA